MKSRISWKRLSGSTKTKIKSMLAQGWQPDRALSPFESERPHRQDEAESAPVTSQDIIMAEEASE